MTLKIKFKKNDKVIQTALLPLLNITFVCHPSKYQTNWPCRAWKITNFVRVFEKRHFLRKVGNQWKFDKKCFSQKNAKLNPKTKTAARFYNILSCFSPNTIPILAFVIEILSIVQAQLVSRGKSLPKKCTKDFWDFIEIFKIFWDFQRFLGFFRDFWDFFWDFWVFSREFFLGFLGFFWDFWDF